MKSNFKPNKPTNDKSKKIKKSDEMTEEEFRNGQFYCKKRLVRVDNLKRFLAYYQEIGKTCVFLFKTVKWGKRNSRKEFCSNP